MENFDSSYQKSKYDYLIEHSIGHMNEIALTFENRKITREEMIESINQYAKMLYSKGAREGDKVGISVFNTPEAVYLIYALDLLGAINVGFNPFQSTIRTKEDIELVKPKMIVTVDHSYSSFKHLGKTLQVAPILYSPLAESENKKAKCLYRLYQIFRGNFSLVKENYLNQILKENFDDINVPVIEYSDGKVRDIMFTGGSTGVHKGTKLCDRNINSAIEGMRHLYDENFFEGKTYLGNIPFGYMAFGRLLLHVALTNNMTYALTLKAMPKDFYSELMRTHADVAAGGPPHWYTLIEKKCDGQYVPRSDLIPGSLANLSLATSGGEKLVDAKALAINEALKFCGSSTVLGDGLGATETYGPNILNSGNYYKPGMIGVPLSTLKVKLVDPKTGNEVKKGEKGLEYISGPSVMLGYYENELETNKVLVTDSDGVVWLNTGDYLSEHDGMYIYRGRQKRVFVCGCDNIYPEDIETLLVAKIPEIREVVVTPIMDDEQQYIPSYHISLYNSDVDISLIEKKINSVVRKNIGASAVPQRIEWFYDELKKMTNSKIDIPYYMSRDSNLGRGNKAKILKR